MHQLLQGGGHGPSPAFLAEYLLPPNVQVDIDLARYPGLLFYYLVQHDTPQQRLCTVWRSRAYYSMAGGRLQAALRATAVAAEGSISHSGVPVKPFWKRQSALTALLALTTLLGALEVLRNHFEAFFVPPSLTLAWDKYRAEYTEGEEFAEPMELVNNLPIPHKRIRLAASWKKQGATAPLALPLHLSPSRVAYLGVGASSDITASGRAPRFGKYEITFLVSARAGHMADRVASTFVRPVTVWPARPAGTLAFRTLADPRTAILGGELYIGPAATNGLDCELTFSPGGGLQDRGTFDFPGLVANSSRFLHSSDALAGGIASMTWRVHPQPERKLILFKFAVSRDGNTDWNKLARDARIACFYREEKLP